MKLFKSVLSISLTAVVFTACQNVEFKKTSAGIPYKIFSSGSSKDSLKEGNFVRLQVIRKTKDTVLFNTYTAKRSVFLQLSKPPAGQPASYSDLGTAIMEILTKAKKGDSIYVVQSTDSLLKNPQQGMGLKPGQQLITTIRVADVFKTKEETDAVYYKEQVPTKEEIAESTKMMKQNFEAFLKDSANASSLQKDEKLIEDYLKAHNIQARKTDFGLYIQDIAPGQGPKPTLKQYTDVSYKGMELSGEVFDSGTYPNVQIGAPGTIPGFWLGIAELSKGGKARIYIPSLLGYGPQGNPPKIKPNEILVFEMELLDISDMPKQQQQQVPVNP